MSPTSPRSALPTATDLPDTRVPCHEDGGEPGCAPLLRETDAMALTPIGLCSRALIKIGAGSITSFNDGTAEAEVADALYSSTRDALLSANSWSFATTQATLALLAEPPLGDYDFAHALPVDFLRALSRASPGNVRCLGYRIVGTTLQTADIQFAPTYVYLPAEAVFPPFFDQV